MNTDMGGLLFGLIALIIVFGLLAFLWDVLLEEFIKWELTWNHPEDRPWHLDPETRWGPRCAWLCSFADWLTGGRCHD